MEAFWGCKLYDIYGATQSVPWVGYTCEKGVLHQGRRGVYHFPEHLAYVEIIDPATGKLVAPGEEGEPVPTTGPEIDEYRGRVFMDRDGKEQASVTLEFRKDVPEATRKAILSGLPEAMKQKIGIYVDLKELPFGIIPPVDYKVRRWSDERETGLERVEFLERK